MAGAFLLLFFLYSALSSWIVLFRDIPTLSLRKIWIESASRSHSSKDPLQPPASLSGGVLRFCRSSSQVLFLYVPPPWTIRPSLNGFFFVCVLFFAFFGVWLWGYNYFFHSCLVLSVLDMNFLLGIQISLSYELSEQPWKLYPRPLYLFTGHFLPCLKVTCLFISPVILILPFDEMWHLLLRG